MITQYEWASVKKQERKHIEIGMMITMLVAIISFYSVPQFQDKVIFEEAYVVPPVKMIKIPVTVQPPEILAPPRPTIPISSEKEDMGEELPEELVFELTGFDYLAPPPTIAPDIPLNPADVSDMPVPIGGYNSIMKRVVYPEIAREAGIEGTVTIEAVIGKNGLIREAKILRGIPKTGLDEAALAAVLETKFHPALQMGRPVPVRMAIPIKFRLK
mgnify:CR=1 FL=1